VVDRGDRFGLTSILLMPSQTRQHGDTAHIELIAVLRDLVAALDRRIPQMGRAGEEAIARDSTALRSKALSRLAELADD
jgi:hypothetical protein